MINSHVFVGRSVCMVAASNDQLSLCRDTPPQSCSYWLMITLATIQRDPLAGVFGRNAARVYRLTTMKMAI